MKSRADTNLEMESLKAVFSMPVTVRDVHGPPVWRTTPEHSNGPQRSLFPGILDPDMTPPPSYIVFNNHNGLEPVDVTVSVSANRVATLGDIISIIEEKVNEVASDEIGYPQFIWKLTKFGYNRWNNALEADVFVPLNMKILNISIKDALGISPNTMMGGVTFPMSAMGRVIKNLVIEDSCTTE